MPPVVAVAGELSPRLPGRLQGFGGCGHPGEPGWQFFRTRVGVHSATAGMSPSGYSLPNPTENLSTLQTNTLVETLNPVPVSVLTIDTFSDLV